MIRICPPFRTNSNIVAPTYEDCRTKIANGPIIKCSIPKALNIEFANGVILERAIFCLKFETAQSPVNGRAGSSVLSTMSSFCSIGSIVEVNQLPECLKSTSRTIDIGLLRFYSDPSPTELFSDGSRCVRSRERIEH